MHETDKMMIFENGKADYRKISDIDLCTELDILAREKYCQSSVYQLSHSDKLVIASELYHKRHLSESQIRRCLALKK